jgi:L-2,4-diaminobutyrate transaminase
MAPEPGVSSLYDLDRHHVFHPFTSIAEQQTAGPRIMTGGNGVWIRDAEGREYMDAMAGLWCVNVGYGREEIAEAMADQARRLAYYHAFMGNANEPAIRLAERLAEITPPGLDRFFFCNSGSEANDTAVKLVWYYWNLRSLPEKKKIIAQRDAYHGVTLGAGSLSGLPQLHAAFDLPLPGFLHVRKPHYYREGRLDESEEAFARRLAEELDALIEAEGPETVGAFIGEPLMGAGGVIPPPENYWQAIQPVLRHHDVLLIADEVVCGFGRLGTPFGSHRYGIEPDLMTVAKGITSGYFPVSAAVVCERVWDVLASASAERGPFAHGHTTSLHPVGAAAALANIDIIERESLVDRAARLGSSLQRRLREAVGDHQLVGEVRGDGLIAAVELVADRASGTRFPAEEKVGMRLHRLLLEDGLISRALGDSMAFSPPLVIEEAEIEEALQRFVRGLERLTGELRAEGRWEG